MIESAPYFVIKNGLDWYGLNVTEQDTTFHITEGRIGLSDNPVQITKEGIEGGWYVAPKSLVLRSTDRSVDLILDKTKDKVLFIIRSNTNDECYSEVTHRFILSFAYRQSEADPWLIAEPLRTYYE